MSLVHRGKRYAKTAARAAALLAKGPVASDGPRALRDLANFLAGHPDGGAGGDAPGLRPRQLEPIDLDAVWPSDRPVHLTELSSSSHNVNERELAVLCALAAVVDARRLFEFGTFDGRTSVNLLRNCPEGHLCTLDLPDEMVQSSTLASTDGGVGRRLRDANDVQDRYTQLRGRSDEFDYAPYAKTIDFVFIDAGHSYELVRNDTQAAAGMLRDNGIIAWHDYGHLRGCEPFPGLTRAVDEFFASGQAPGRGVWFRGTRVAACIPASVFRT